MSLETPDNASLWRIAQASTAGVSHLAHHLPCQDFALTRQVTTPDGKTIVFLVAADGAGSATHAELGAKVVVASFLGLVQLALEQGRRLTDFGQTDINHWLAITRQAVDVKAAELGATSHDLAATVLGCCIGDGATLWWQIGDGAIVLGRGPGDYAVACWPAQGEYANETTFVTSANAPAEIRWGLIPHECPRIGVFTDGLQRLLLDYRQQQPVAAWFDVQFGFLAGLPPGSSPALDQALTTLISGPRFVDQTEDDRTLILACR